MSYQASYRSTPVPGYYVASATVEGIPAPCVGDDVSLSVANSTGQSIGSGGPIGIGTSTVSVPISKVGQYYPTAHDVTSVTVTFTSLIVASNLEITSGTRYTCSTGLKINANVTVDTGGTFVGNGCIVNGNITSSGSVTFAGGKLSGNLQASAGDLAVSSGAAIGGNLQISGGGPISAAQSTVGGFLQIQGVVGSVTATICGMAVKGNLTVQSTAEPLQLGGSRSCNGNTIGNNMTVQSNSGELTLGSGLASASGPSSTGNGASGNIQVQSNTGSASTFAGNWSGGNCTLSQDDPVIGVPSPTSNFAKKNNKCKVSG
ncbi:MAG TPA: hypothetical protein VE990_11560 [Acidimicrobiales bacterium]|nr:hypothetical protein [Acidimicrobiales bacterium]